MKKSIAIPNAPKPIGPYSQAVELNNMLFISGQIPIVPESGIQIQDNIKGETAQCLQNIEALLVAAGYKKGNLVKCSIFLTDMGFFPEVNEVYASFFKDEVFPARETVQVSALPASARVEISAIAVK
ncbi:MAG: Rid family detoxifying hydrolase [Luteibaculaceae bacterium]